MRVKVNDGTIKMTLYSVLHCVHGMHLKINEGNLLLFFKDRARNLHQSQNVTNLNVDKIPALEDDCTICSLRFSFVEHKFAYRNLI